MTECKKILLGILVLGILLSYLQLFNVTGIASADELAGSINSSQQSLEGSAKSPEIVPGGAAMADFGTLMNLIESTIDPDSWLSQGGSSAMLPYPAGVWVDPRGQLKRRPVLLMDPSSVENLQRVGQAGSKAGQAAWHQHSPLRIISLRQLDQLLLDVSRRQSKMSPEILRLAGLSQVQYVLIDSGNEDVLLAGPANGHQNGFFLEDLALVAGLIHGDTQPFGCSIEPNQKSMLQTQEYISTSQAQKLLSQSPEKFAKRLEQLMGHHDVQVFGMHSKTSTAVALLAADVSMKQLGFGKSELPLQVNTYFDFLERESVIPKQSLVRWWFDYSDRPIASNREQTLFRLPDDCVELYSEQQFLTEHGRQATGQRDAAADAFAVELNEHLVHLRQLEPCYSRMCCVFEAALGLQIARESAGVTNYRGWFPTLCGLGQMEHQFVQEPQLVSGLVATHQSQLSRTNLAVVSGGVQVNPIRMARRDNWRVASHLSGSAVPQLAASQLAASQSQEGVRWWWDCVGSDREAVR